MPGLPPARPRGRAALLPRLLLLLLAGHVARAQNWRNENYEQPIDLEGSGDDDPFEDEEIEETEEFYSGSGSGYFEQQPVIKTVVQLTTGAPVLLATTAAGLPTTSVQPVVTPFAPLPTEEATSSPAEGSPSTTRTSEVAAGATQRAASTAMVWDIAVTTTTATTASTTTATPKPTTVQRALPPLITVVATTQAITLDTPTTATVARTEVTAAPLVTTSLAKTSTVPKPSTSPEPDLGERSSTVLQPASPAAPTQPSQGKPLNMTLSTSTNNELEVPISGDFEIHEEEDTAQTELSNEVVALVTPTAGPGLRKNAEPGLIDNTIESGNSAAQLPQKNILERKEVLIAQPAGWTSRLKLYPADSETAVIVGGVVGALFAAFLVMLLIYRMKKKDEGSYTLEEPKQASVTYQKPDKQEEFYA